MRAYLIGDFNNWDRDATPMTKNDFGVFEVTVPGKDGQPAIPHDSKIKVRLLCHEATERANSGCTGIFRRP
jgi:1,4-alpha-glucan branching enzyme